MLMPRVIPCLDIDGGRVVKGQQFKGIKDIGDPVDLAQRYEAEGADELVLLDISATPNERSHALDVVAAIRLRLSIPLTVGGGIRSRDDASLVLNAGADKVAVNTAAVRHPQLIDELATTFGRQCVVLAMDVTRNREGVGQVVIRSGREKLAFCANSWAQEAVARGAGEILLTSFDQDGMRKGYDLSLIRAIAKEVNVPIIASGGANTPKHMVEALDAGAAAVLAASIFHYGDWTVRDLKQALFAKGKAVRQ